MDYARLDEFEACGSLLPPDVILLLAPAISRKHPRDSPTLCMRHTSAQEGSSTQAFSSPPRTLARPRASRVFGVSTIPSFTRLRLRVLSRALNPAIGTAFPRLLCRRCSPPGTTHQHEPPPLPTELVVGILSRIWSFTVFYSQSSNSASQVWEGNLGTVPTPTLSLPPPTVMP